MKGKIIIGIFKGLYYHSQVFFYSHFKNLKVIVDLVSQRVSWWAIIVPVAVSDFRKLRRGEILNSVCGLIIKFQTKACLEWSDNSFWTNTHCFWQRNASHFC